MAKKDTTWGFFNDVAGLPDRNWELAHRGTVVDEYDSVSIGHVSWRGIGRGVWPDGMA